MEEARQKRVRTCVGCGTQSDKVQLLRIVRTDEGVKFDATGRVPGRGAYVCSQECLSDAFSSRKLQRALRCSIERSNMDQVMADMATLSAQTR
ncbi:MAG: YlxR family protein [Eggerthellaceae bacterium]|nr:YlxR family protein [Eggerthellaceae bacterium]